LDQQQRVLYQSIVNLHISKLVIAASIHVMIDVCFTFGDARWCIVWPNIVLGTTTFLSLLSSHADTPTQSRLNTNYIFIPWTYSLRQRTVSFRKTRGTLSHVSSQMYFWFLPRCLGGSE
jgi:hypothetical protein